MIWGPSEHSAVRRYNLLRLAERRKNTKLMQFCNYSSRAPACVHPHPHIPFAHYLKLSLIDKDNTKSRREWEWENIWISFRFRTSIVILSSVSSLKLALRLALFLSLSHLLRSSKRWLIENPISRRNAKSYYPYREAQSKAIACEENFDSPIRICQK